MLNKLIGKYGITAAAVVCAFAALGATSAAAGVGDAADNAAPNTEQDVTFTTPPPPSAKTFTRVWCNGLLVDKPWGTQVPPITGHEVFSGGVATITIQNSALNLPYEDAPDCLIKDVHIKMSPVNQSGTTVAKVIKQSNGLGRVTINGLKMKSQITATFENKVGHCVTRAPHIVLNLTSAPTGDPPNSRLFLHGEDYNNTTGQAVLVSKKIKSPKIVPVTAADTRVCGFINTNFGPPKGKAPKSDIIGFSWEVKVKPPLW